MLSYPNIDPVALQIGPVSVHWYGIMYLVGFGGGWWLGRYRARQPWRGWRPLEVDDLVFYAALGVILGGRFGYVFFYNFSYFLADPTYLLRIWEGGMSFHGGLLGVVLSMWFFARKTKRSFFDVTDFLAPLCALGLGAGRIGNFINAELWGKTTEVPWGMVFPGGGPLPRHPSQLYQALLEGLLLFVLLWWFSSKPRHRMATSGLFLLIYGCVRFVIEFVRIPDEHIGYLAYNWVTMGQALSLPMVVGGIVLIALSANAPVVVVAPDAEGSDASPQAKPRRKQRRGKRA